MTDQQYQDQENQDQEHAEVELHEQEGQQAESQEREGQSEIEQEARSLGWKPPDEWQGEKGPGYIGDPQEYLDRLQRSYPFRVMREQLEKKDQEAEERIRKIEAGVQAAHQRDLERQRQEYERQLNEITARQRDAVQNADTRQWEALEKQKRELQPPQEGEQQQSDPVEPFMEEKPWLKDPMLRQHGAQAIDIAVRSGELPPSADAKQQVEFAEQKVRQYFPHLFEGGDKAEEKKSKPRVDAGGLAGGAKKEGFDSLPKEAKDTFRRQVKKGFFEDTPEDRQFYYEAYQNG